MFALSTSWNFNHEKPISHTIEQIRKMGFLCIELAFSHTQREIKEIVNYPNIKIVSLHNYCPIPNGLSIKEALPDCYSLSSINSNERKKAIKFTKRTILFAKKLKAKAVVLHTGRVQIPDYTKQLIKLKLDNNTNHREFDVLKDLAIKERGSKKEKFIDSALLSLRELTNFAYNEGIAIGIENRIYIREIPNFYEIKIFLDNFSRKGLYYWHDTGHAYILEKLGFAKHLDYLKSYRKHLIGMHLHDVKDFQDHKAPFTGEIDFEIFKSYIKKDTIKVIEVHKPTTTKEIIFAKQGLEEIFNCPN